ncbi:MAG: 2-aminoethylphosphonate--pyruvate transaminase [Alphaproteobacteria bacterium]|jgi:2-aminoethylphosphonate-pyruvate transaminase|nr:2-aminoethylphosphonate--pyruvate transaminase [Alphaproteobacteria bacterium]
MTAPKQDPWLLTPGPLTTSMQTKQAMLHDWGSRDAAFIATNRRVLDRLVAIAGGTNTHVCVPVQGSGTFAVEATLGTMIPREAKALVLINGAYGTRMAKILEYAGRAFVTLETPEDTPPDIGDIESILTNDGDITHVVAVFCETTSGILNPIADIARVTADHGRRLIIDAMSAFGALPINAAEVPFDALMASSNKCLEGVPGMGFAILRRDALETCQGNAHALSLDLYDQWTAMEGNGQWRFTPPTHVICAFDAAMEQFDSEGGQAGRFARYSANCRIIVDGMRELGFETLLPDDLQAPIIITFKMPIDPAFDFQTFYDALGTRGFLIYPGKLTVAPSFRIGCIGHLGKAEMNGALAAIKETLAAMGVTNGAPAA